VLRGWAVPVVDTCKHPVQKRCARLVPSGKSACRLHDAVIKEREQLQN
jgi:hypothetical protein